MSTIICSLRSEAYDKIDLVEQTGQLFLQRCLISGHKVTYCVIPLLPYEAGELAKAIIEHFEIIKPEVAVSLQVNKGESDGAS